MKDQLIGGGILALQILLFIASAFFLAAFFGEFNVINMIWSVGLIFAISYVVTYFAGKKLRSALLPDTQAKKSVNVWVVAFVFFVLPFICIFSISWLSKFLN